MPRAHRSAACRDRATFTSGWSAARHARAARRAPATLEVPNPARWPLRARLSRPGRGPLELRLFDPGGRLLWRA